MLGKLLIFKVYRLFLSYPLHALGMCDIGLQLLLVVVVIMPFGVKRAKRQLYLGCRRFRVYGFLRLEYLGRVLFCTVIDMLLRSKLVLFLFFYREKVRAIYHIACRILIKHALALLRLHPVQEISAYGTAGNTGIKDVANTIHMTESLRII